MTHIENMPHILKHGITSKFSFYANKNYIPIGDESLIQNREVTTLVVNNGLNPNPQNEKIQLRDFIPFYFGVKMPMLYVAQKGGNFVSKPIKAENVIYLACSLEDIISRLDRYYFTDGHAKNKYSSIYDKTFIQKLPEIINWKAIIADYWGDDENQDIKRLKQAEFLIGEDIPLGLIHGIACYNINAQERLMKMGVEKELVKVFPKGYF